MEERDANLLSALDAADAVRAVAATNNQLAAFLVHDEAQDPFGSNDVARADALKAHARIAIPVSVSFQPVGKERFLTSRRLAPQSLAP